jgi:hypothetical protein
MHLHVIQWQKDFSFAICVNAMDCVPASLHRHAGAVRCWLKYLAFRYIKWMFFLFLFLVDSLLVGRAISVYGRAKRRICIKREEKRLQSRIIAVPATEEDMKTRTK